MEKLSNFNRQEKISIGKINDKMKEIEIAFQLPENIKGKVSQLYLKAKRKRLLKGRDLKTIFAACLYVIIRKEEIPRTITDVTKKLDVSLKKIGHLSKILARELEIKFPPVDIFSLIDRFCFELNLSDKVKSKAKEILKKAVKLGVVNGLSQKGIAAAIVYIAAILSGEHRSQNEISKITEVTEVTIRNIYKEIAKELNIDVFI